MYGGRYGAAAAKPPLAISRRTAVALAMLASNGGSTPSSLAASIGKPLARKYLLDGQHPTEVAKRTEFVTSSLESLTSLTKM